MRQKTEKRGFIILYFQSSTSFYLRSKMDPLALVREATTKNTPVNYTDSHYIFGNVKLHESTETAFKKRGGG
jgi:hypothetical protein